MSSKLYNLKNVVDIFHCFPLLPDISSETLRTRRSIRRQEMGRNRANRKEDERSDLGLSRKLAELAVVTLAESKYRLGVAVWQGQGGSRPNA